jgi:hypothetical protein
LILILAGPVLSTGKRANPPARLRERTCVCRSLRADQVARNADPHCFFRIDSGSAQDVAADARKGSRGKRQCRWPAPPPGLSSSMRLSSGRGVLWWHPSLSLGGLSRSSPDGAARARSADSCSAAGRIPAEPMSGSVVLDAAGRRRSPATMPGFHAGHPPRNKGLRYPADPPTVEEIVAVMRIAGDGRHGRRLRGLIVVLWRAGLRIDEALALREADLDRRRGSILVRRGKGGRRREIGMDD